MEAKAEVALLALGFAALKVYRRTNGRKACRAFMLPLRGVLDDPLSAVMPAIGATEGLREASDIAARACRSCGKCDLAQR